MNYLLLLNRKYVLIFSVIFFVCFFLFYLINFYFIFDYKSEENNLSLSNIDIKEPKFSINNKIERIIITAREGNFVDQDKILLTKDVKFVSNNFSILSDNVVFDRKNLVATSEKKAKFLSKNTSIISRGFDITENGNIINFKGQTVLTIK